MRLIKRQLELGTYLEVTLSKIRQGKRYGITVTINIIRQFLKNILYSINNIRYTDIKSIMTLQLKKERYLNQKRNLEEEVKSITVVDLDSYLERTKKIQRGLALKP